ncbi:hypothetical protein NQ317_009158 [Molorchus minor]|uniref:ZAD domain-containing protein n=1 Tax=Molorchus minor TaxID=1323400 RepID=A0ABQ9K2B2_9CUCU|nr:hypothetical protein NQ317_009158 [Molorchus minor]
MVNLCRFCLSELGSDFKPIEDYTIFNSLLLDVNLAITDDPSMCKTCAEDARLSINFKRMCMEKQQIVTSFAVLKGAKLLELDEVIHKGKKVLVPRNRRVCRFCTEILKTSSLILMSDVQNKWLLGARLIKHFFSVDYRVQNPLVCPPCVESLTVYLNFATTCATTEESITQYWQKQGTNSRGEVDLTDVRNFTCKTLGYDPGYKDITIKKEEISVDGIYDTEVDLKQEPGDLSENQTQQKQLSGLTATTNNDDESQVSNTYLDATLGMELQVETTTERFFRSNPHTYGKKLPLKPSGSKAGNAVAQEEPITIVGKGTGKRYKCEKCDYATNHAGGIKVHRMRHKNSWFQCNKCDFYTKYEQTMEKHNVQRHLLHDCDVCGYKLAKHELALHLATHLVPYRLLQVNRTCAEVENVETTTKEGQSDSLPSSFLGNDEVC